MAFSFNADEMFTVAIEMERGGARFYERAKEQTGDADAALLLGELSEWEKEHEARFTSMQERFNRERPDLGAFDPTGEAAQYLAALADNRVFPRDDPSEKLSGEESLEEVLRTALGLEKDSITFYVGMREFVPEELGKGEVGEIIAEEMKHVRLLSGKLAG